ncbi:MAG TPA: RAMP superfamily CRISPR-associated protein [Ktedonobacteraceae bacterium]|jgi:CRISPR/Cas system CSM-associated protein Csm3 (group 7 of RAMP superfamily)|nr:RAMP superfamily CRISPR-associated protein [Ktedonobacteraceae bacterium]
MLRASWSGDVSRKIVGRIVVEGDLVLKTPAHLGNGDGDDLVDMPLLTDPLDGKTPLLTGASIAGALRGYLREREHGFRAKIGIPGDTSAKSPASASILLFGSNKGYKYGEQSPLIVEDARGKDAAIELRDGVRLAGKSRTSAEDALFSIEMWEAGTIFPLRFELIVRERDTASELKRALATALTGFKDGSITIGARKRRGYGQVSVAEWRIKEYDLTKIPQLLDWIENGAQALHVPTVTDIAQAFGVGELITDRRRSFHLEAKFSLDGSLLIRSGSGPDIEQANANDAEIVRPDTMHLHSWRPASSLVDKRERRPVLPGTSLAGALRARAFKIARLLVPPTDAGEKKARELIDGMFGADMEIDKKPAGSRVHVYEQVVSVSDVGSMLVQNRVSIDRFTGGTRDGALFNEQPLLGGAQSVVMMELQLENPRAYEIGLLLLLLKDLWTGDLPLGGEIAVGRGRLRGKSCELVYQNGQERSWALIANGVNGLKVEQGNPGELEQYVMELHTHLVGSKP